MRLRPVLSSAFTLVVSAALAFASATLPAAAQETRVFEDDLGRPVEIPVDPQRIAAMADHALAVPLVELGSALVASQGRIGEDGEPFFRSVVDLFPEALASRDIQFIGTQIAIDYEALAAAEPDLIIGRTWDEGQLDQLTPIAPVLLLDDRTNAFDFYRKVADAAGRLDVFETLKETYRLAVEKQKVLLGDHDHTYQRVAFSGSSTISVCGSHGALGQALDDLGFRMIGVSAEIESRGEAFCEDVSPEVLAELDADFLFDSYRTDVFPSDPIGAEDRVEDTFPGACQLLTACAEGRMIFVPREYAFPASFRSATTMLHFVVSHVAGRPGMTRPD
ncbi:MAG: ABC transporter substrate-binding protein [Pseudomonadota bacterium]